MQILDLDAPLGEVGRELLGHLLRQGGDKDSFVAFDAHTHLLQEVVDLALGGLDDDERVNEARRANDLLDDAVGAFKLVGAGGRRQVDGLSNALGKLIPLQRAVVHRGGQAEPIVDEGALTRHVSLKHRADLWNGHVRLVDDEQEVVGEVVQQRVRRRARSAPVDVARIVLDTRARADFFEHLQVEGGAHAQALLLEQLVLAAEPRKAIIELILDGGDRLLHTFLAGHVVRGREKVRVVDVIDDVAGERMENGKRLDLVAEHLDADRELLIHGDDLDRIAAHAERAARKSQVVAHVLHGDEAPQESVAVDDHTPLELNHAGYVFLGSTEAVDARHRGDDDRVAPREQRVRSAVAQPLDLVVDRGVLLDEGIRLGNVGLGLVVIVVGDKVLDGVVRKQLAELGRELGCKRLVRLKYQSGTLQLLNQPGRGRALTRARRAHENDVLFAVSNARSQLPDRLGLVARRRIGRDDLERLVLAGHDVTAHAPTLPPRQVSCAHKAHGFATSVVAPASSHGDGSVRGQPTLIDEARDFLEVVGAALVVNPDRCDRAALLRRGLGADTCTRVLGRNSPALQALNAFLDGCVHDDDRIEAIRMVPFDEKRNIVDREAPLRGFTQDRPRARLNEGVGDGIEPSDAFVSSFTPEDPGGQERAVQAPILPQQVASKSTCDLAQRRLARFEDLPCNRVGVRRHRTLSCEDARHRGLT